MICAIKYSNKIQCSFKCVNLQSLIYLILGFSGSSENPCSDIFRGSGPADQVETQSVIRKLTEIAPQTKLFLTFHSYGQLILIPYGYQAAKRPENFKELVRVYWKSSDFSERISYLAFVCLLRSDTRWSETDIATFIYILRIHEGALKYPNIRIRSS